MKNPSNALAPNLTGLKTRIVTASLDASIQFYSDFLGLTVIERWDSDGDIGAILGLSASIDSNAFIELAYQQEVGTYSGVSIQIRVESIATAIQKFQGKLEFTGPKERPWGSRYLYLTDPSNVSVILYEGRL